MLNNVNPFSHKKIKYRKISFFFCFEVVLTLTNTNIVNFKYFFRETKQIFLSILIFEKKIGAEEINLVLFNCTNNFIGFYLLEMNI